MRKRATGLSRRPYKCSKLKRRYCFSTHFLPASSHILPAFSQSSLFVIVDPGPANAGAANASATATASVEITAFMTFSPWAGFKPERNARFTHYVAGSGGLFRFESVQKYGPCGSSRRLCNPTELPRLSDGRLEGGSHQFIVISL